VDYNKSDFFGRRPPRNEEGPCLLKEQRRNSEDGPFQKAAPEIPAADQRAPVMPPPYLLNSFLRAKLKLQLTCCVQDVSSAIAAIVSAVASVSLALPKQQTL
jgi:hypothetical protein